MDLGGEHNHRGGRSHRQLGATRLIILSATWSLFMSQPVIKIDFYHDVVCGWCFVIAPRLRKLSEELPLEIRHRSFVLQDSREEMVRAWGSLERAKREILGHWERCREADDDKSRINVEGMWKQTFEYPSGMIGTLGCKAAEIQGGQAAHWDMFDAVQRAHLTDNRNIGDAGVIVDVAMEIGLDISRFERDLHSAYTGQKVEEDRAKARGLGIRSIPSVVIEEAGVVLGTAPTEVLRSQLLAIQEHLRAGSSVSA
jgi:predicted DsbA family dithiol-disulfide isomerase